VAGILPAVCSGILPPGWKPAATAARDGRRYRFMAPMRDLRFVEAFHDHNMNTSPLSALRVLILGALCLLAAPPAHAATTARWPQFRGPNGSGVAERGRPPIHFGPASNVLWRVSPHSGQSSPCIWDERIFLTTFASNQLSTVCLDRESGRVLWSRLAPAEKIEPFHSTGSPAAATLATVNDDSTMKLWHLETGREVASFPIPFSAVRVAFSPDARFLVAVGQGVMVLRAPSLEEIAELATEQEEVSAP
jgi:hypothetical protein